MLSTSDKKQVIDAFKVSDKDTGSAEVQIALITSRMKTLSEHLSTFKKDLHSKRGLLKLVDTRKKLLRYLERTNRPAYLDVIKRLEIRK